MKKKKLFISFMALVVLFAFAQMAMAYTVATVNNYGPYQTGLGGEFSLQPADGLQGVLNYYNGFAKNQAGNTPNFQTFCVETNEYIWPNTLYSATLSNAAIKGGVGGPRPDPVSKGTADLYYQFATNTWTGGLSYKYGDAALRLIDAANLQQTIWWLEEEGLDPGAGNQYRNYVLTTYTTEAGARADNAGLFSVMAVNVWELDQAGNLNYIKQDMLTVVPIPAAAWLLGSGLIGLVVIRRRMKK